MASKTPPSEVLAGWLAGRRWFGTRTRRIVSVAVEDAVPLGGGTLALVLVTLDSGASDRYAVPLGPWAPGAEGVADALDDPGFCRALLDVIVTGARVSGAKGEVWGARTSAFPTNLPGALPVRRIGGEQTNTSVVFGDALILKHFRRLSEGPNPEEEMTRFLTERAHFPHAPRLFGHIEYRRADGARLPLAVVQELVTGVQDGWEWMLAALGDFYGRVRAAGGPPVPRQVRALGGATLGALRHLGALTAELHLALASDPHDPAFAPEPITAEDVAGWTRGVMAQLAAARTVAGGDLTVDQERVRLGLDGLRGLLKIRHHGDLHLGQTLFREADGRWVIIDFEGEPARPLDERRRKHAALRDVAGLLRSLNYAAVAAAPSGLEAWPEAWEMEASRDVLASYLAVARSGSFLPESDDAFRRALAVFELEKAAYEVVYEANHRPDWLPIPRRGLLRAAARLRPSGSAGEA